MTETLGKIAGAIAIGLMLAGMCYGDIFVGAKTSTVFHTTTCRYATTATAYSWPTYEDATAFNRVPCKTCKPTPTPVIAEPNRLPTVSEYRTMTEQEQLVILPALLAQYLFELEPNSLPIYSQGSSNSICIQWTNDPNRTGK